VIASGLKFYGVDDIYIDEEILGVLYLRNRKPSEYLIFPHAASVIPPKCHCASGTKLTKEEEKGISDEGQLVAVKDRKIGHSN